MKINKNKDAAKSPEYIARKNKIREILLNIRTIGSVTRDLIYLIEDEIKKDRIKKNI